MSTRLQAQAKTTSIISTPSFTPVRSGLLQRRAKNQREPATAPPIVHEKLRSPGQPLGDNPRLFTEPRFRYDFSRVPVRTAAPMMTQAKLIIGRPGDKYEREADRVADMVMRMPGPRLQRQVEPEEEEEEEETLRPKPLAGQIMPLVQRQIEPNEEEEEWPPVYDVEPTEDVGELEPVEAERQEPGWEEEGEEEEGSVQAKLAGEQTPRMGPGLAAQIRSLGDGGQPLSPPVRNFFEPRFGHDFSRVPVRAAAPVMIQAKLTIGRPGDKYEREADRIADLVMRMPDPGLQRQVEPEGEEEEEETLRPKPLAGQIMPLVQRQIEPNEEEEEWPPVYDVEPTRDAGELEPAIPEEEWEDYASIQPKRAPGTPPRLGPGPQAQIRSLKGSGRSLSQAERDFFEPRFGYCFDNVQIRTHASAEHLCQAMNAQAFTFGHGIALSPGRYRPGTTTGRKLIAHELVHVVQQDSAPQRDAISSIQWQPLGEEERRQIRRLAQGSATRPPGRGPDRGTALILKNAGCRYILTIKVDAPGHGYSWRGLAKSYARCQRAGPCDVGHTWFRLWDTRTTKSVVQGGHSGETRDAAKNPTVASRPEFLRYATGVEKLASLGQNAPSPLPGVFEATPDNPIQWLHYMYEDGHWAPHNAGHTKVTKECSWCLSFNQYQAVKKKIAGLLGGGDPNADVYSPALKYYGLTGKQCTSTAADVAAAAGIKLNPYVTISIPSTALGRRLWTDSVFSSINLAMPDKMASEISKASGKKSCR